MKIIKNIYKRTDQRGTFLECINQNIGWKSINVAFMKKGAVMGNHYHKKCHSYLFIISGQVEVLVKNTLVKKSKIHKFLLSEGEGAAFDPYETHAWTHLKKTTLLFIKSKKYNEKNKDINPAKLI